MVRPVGYERQSWWAEQPVVHLVRVGTGARGAERFSDWTPRDAVRGDTTVEVYSNCEQVELVLNGKSLGAKPRPRDDAPRVWKTPFAAGTIQAHGKNSGKTVATHELRSAGKPAKIVLAADRLKLSTAWDDVAYVTATVADDKGVAIPWANDLIEFKLTGAGVLAAIDNGDLASHESYRGAKRQAFQGQCVAILKATAPGSKITLSASASGLTAGSLTLETIAPVSKQREKTAEQPVVQAQPTKDPPTDWIDPDTGHRVVRLSTEPGSARSLLPSERLLRGWPEAHHHHAQRGVGNQSQDARDRQDRR